ncbi:MAG: hypothetical protein L0241_16070 [Planctomycetia bacterium]|nr:hypothetical protein [Planctomycetia bacterium]
MNATEPLTRDAINQFLGQLTDDQKRYVLAKLLPTFFAANPGLVIVYDEEGKLVGELNPSRPVQPGQKIGMSDEARAALAKVKRITLAEWRAERAKTANATPTGTGE